MKRIDLHCHVLPGVDDGAADLEESLRMLKSAAKQGVYAVVATSHYSRQFRNEEPERNLQDVEELQKRAREEIKEKFYYLPRRGSPLYTGYSRKTG